MTLKDFIVTPVLIIIIIIITFLVKDRFTDRITRRYLFPALLLKIFGAIMLGLIYQFYYKGGDTFNFFNFGSYFIWKAFLDSPAKGLSLIFSPAGTYSPATYEYASKILYFQDPSSFFVIRAGGLFDLLTFHTYSATAVLFTLFSFSGLWAMFISLYRRYPRLHLQLAVAIFFLPSVIFWGSGLLKDSLTLGALGWATYAFVNIFFNRKSMTLSGLILVLSFYILYKVKIYILLCYAPSLLIWVYLEYVILVKNPVARIMLLPVAISLVIVSGYLAVHNISGDNPRYNISSISQTAEATARWISYVSEVEGGSTYSLGDYDFSSTGLISKSYKAVWVTLFRPYLWESKNPVMILSALESFFFLVLTIYIIVRSGIPAFFRSIASHPVILFCLVFAVTFSFAVGISTYNFGSLVRYKIPMMPFYILALLMISHYSKRPKKFFRLDPVE